SQIRIPGSEPHSVPRSWIDYRRKQVFSHGLLGLQLERVRAAQPRGTRVEVWFQDEARIGQKNSLTRVWGQTGSRPVAPKDLGFASAYLFGAVCPSQGKAAALIMPICNTAAMNHHLCEISSQVADDAHAVVILDGASWHNSHGLVVPSNVTLLALPPLQPRAQSS